jgi:O-antigen/teichoic acid export membrane protein
VSLVQIPFHASIIAHERMQFFAYMSIVDVLLKLGIVFLLPLFGFDKLKFYAVLMLAVGAIGFVCYQIYCHKNFENIRFRPVLQWSKFRPFLAFSTWSLFASFANLMAIQGVNLVVNLFYGVTVNAAMAIADRVNNAVFSFVWNFQIASQPMLVKSYAAGDIDFFERLLARTAKFSFLLCFVLVAPLILNMDFILHLWLKEPPPSTALFCKWTLVNFLVVGLITSFGFGIETTGNIKRISILNSLVTCSTILFTYLFFRLGFQPIVALYVILAVRLVVLGNNLYFTRRQLGISFGQIFRRVFLRIFVVVGISVPPAFIIASHTYGWLQLLLSCVTFVCVFIPATWFVGLEESERTAVKTIVRQKLLFFKQL